MCVCVCVCVYCMFMSLYECNYVSVLGCVSMHMCVCVCVCVCESILDEVGVGIYCLLLVESLHSIQTAKTEK